MNDEKEVKPVVWSTEEPEIPAKPQSSVSTVEQTQEGEVVVTETAAQPVPMERGLPAGIQQDSTHAYVWENAATAAAVVRAIIRRDPSSAVDGPLAGMSPRQEVAALMAALGAEVGSTVIRHLGNEADARWVGRAVAEEPEVKHSVAMYALNILHQRIESGDYLQEGGPALASDLFERAFGSSRDDSCCGVSLGKRSRGWRC